MHLRSISNEVTSFTPVSTRQKPIDMTNSKTQVVIVKAIEAAGLSFKSKKILKAFSYRPGQ